MEFNLSRAGMDSVLQTMAVSSDMRWLTLELSRQIDTDAIDPGSFRVLDVRLETAPSGVVIDR
jgi:hypothetical protein